MLNSKTNRIALYVSAFVVIALILFAIFRDNADSITLGQANTILDNRSVKKCSCLKKICLPQNG